MSKTTVNSTVLAIVQALRSDPDAVRDHVGKIPFNALVGMAETFVEDFQNFVLTQKTLRNSAPEVPGDNPPGKKKYPSREETTPTPLPVPDPADTEDAPNKTTGEIQSLKEFSDSVALLSESGQALWKLETGERDSEEKSTARRNTFNALEFVRQTIHSL
jgi:hypothetical protein